jgi:N-methylhydantoinase A/oxoprolinase/acetone carboxylase beta subunit
MNKLGIDVGGTNIDFAVVDQHDQLLYGTKVLNNQDFQSCLRQCIKTLTHQYGFKPSDISVIHLGTTLAINSLLERKSLAKVGVLRIAGHAPDLPPAYQWPADYRAAILAGYETIPGGREYNNSPLMPFDSKRCLAAVDKLLQQGAESIAITSVFSPFYAEDELKAEACIRSRMMDLPISLSHRVGSLGFITRENTTILNATLQKVLRMRFAQLQYTLDQLGFQCECFITQNNGTLLTISEAIEFPVKTIASGPTNSIKGACKLANCAEGIVVDIGGTSTDLGLIQQGLPIYSLGGSCIEDISCQLLTPDVNSLAMGGGSIINKVNGTYQIGPNSLGETLFDHCLSVGGSYLTLYDVGRVLNENSHCPTLSNKEAQRIMEFYLTMVENEARRLSPLAKNTPILLVGGGSANIPDYFFNNQFIRPDNFSIANAYGAALSEIAGEIDCIIDCTDNKEDQLNNLEEKAKQIAIKNGASSDSVKIIEKKILPLHYMPIPKQRVVITAAGRREATLSVHDVSRR